MGKELAKEIGVLDRMIEKLRKMLYIDRPYSAVITPLKDPLTGKWRLGKHRLTDKQLKKIESQKGVLSIGIEFLEEGFDIDEFRRQEEAEMAGKGRQPYYYSGGDRSR